MVQSLDVAPMAGRVVRLEPLTEAHVDDLVAAATEDESTYGFTSVPSGPAAMAEHVATLVAARSAGEVVPFAQVRLADDRAVGMTRYLELRWRPGRGTPYAVEIGGTWLAASAQRTGINREAKLLLLTHAFDVWRVGRVDFKTDARNQRSRAALLGIGATFEAVLRNWQPSHARGESGLRDTAMFSVTDGEWPSVRDRLTDGR